MNDTNKKLREVIADILGLEADDVDEDAAVNVTPGWDSMQHLAIMGAVQQEWHIEFSPEDLKELSSLQLIANRIGDASNNH